MAKMTVDSWIIRLLPSLRLTTKGVEDSNGPRHIATCVFCGSRRFKEGGGFSPYWIFEHPMCALCYKVAKEEDRERLLRRCFHGKRLAEGCSYGCFCWHEDHYSLDCPDRKPRY